MISSQSKDSLFPSNSHSNDTDQHLVDHPKNLPIELLISDDSEDTEETDKHNKDKKQIGESEIKFQSNSSTGVNLKLLKACTFCRKRKVKCVVPPNSQSCQNCIQRNNVCVFDHKFIMRTKRKLVNKDHSSTQEKIKKIDADVISFTKNPGKFRIKYDPVTQGSHIFVATTTKSQADKGGHKIKLNISGKEGTENPLVHLYDTHIGPYTPFISPTILHSLHYSDSDLKLDKFSQFCIHVASVSSPINQIPSGTSDFLLDVLADFLYNDHNVNWNEASLSCFFLLPLRIKVPSDIVEDKLKRFIALYKSKNGNVSINLIVGAMVVDAFYTLLEPNDLVTNNLSLLSTMKSYIDTLNKKCFNYHFLSVGYLIYKYFSLSRNEVMESKERRIKLLKLEFEMLLWPVMLTRELSVVEDDLLATPEAFLLHVLHNMLLTVFYYGAIMYEESFGEMKAVFAVPGLYHFIAGMAKSTFRMSDEIVNRWSIIANCQVQTAKLTLALYEVMEFDSIISALRCFKKHGSVLDEDLQNRIHNQVQALLDKHEYYNERDQDSDGAKVFWVFRDIRSLSIQMYLNDIADKV